LGSPLTPGHRPGVNPPAPVCAGHSSDGSTTVHAGGRGARLTRPRQRRPAPTPSTCGGGLTPGRRPGAHRNRHDTVCLGTARWRVRPPRGMAPGLVYPDRRTMESTRRRRPQTPSDRAGGPTPGPWPGAHRNKPNTVCPVKALGGSIRTPGLTAPRSAPSGRATTLGSPLTPGHRPGVSRS